MDERLYEALEDCLQALETGVDLESVLKRYPDLSDELRPILEASIQARSLAVTDVPADAMRRGRARVLQHAAGMREAARKPRWQWPAFRRFATVLAVLFLLMMSSTGLVRASSSALPGDNLYPVKRSWEDVRLLFSFKPEVREELESEFEQERLDEISELLAEGRHETIRFAGLVRAKNGDQWTVSGITVVITPATRFPVDPVDIGAPVAVTGRTNAQGFVEAEQIEILASGVSLPPLGPTELEEPEDADDDEKLEDDRNVDESDSESDTESPSEKNEENDGNENEDDAREVRNFSFRGVVESKQENRWVINGQTVIVDPSVITGQVPVGAIVEFEGYYSNNGQFIVTKIEIKSGNRSGSSENENGQDDNEKENDNGDEDDGNSNDDDHEENDNDGGDDNDNDSSGGGDDDD